REVLRMEVLSPDQVVNRFEALLRRALGEPIKLTLALATGSAFCRVDAGQLSGLGLSQVYGFIRQSGGILTVDTEIDAGTTFSLYLPRVEARAQPSPQ